MDFYILDDEPLSCTQAGQVAIDRPLVYGVDWTPEELAKLKRLMEEGASRSDAAIALNRTYGSITAKLHHMGIHAFRQTFWTDWRVRKLEELVQQGLSCSKIGAILGTTRNAIIGKCQRQGFKLANSHSGERKERKASPKRPSVRRPKGGKSPRPYLAFSLIPKETIELPTDQSPFKCTLAEIKKHQCRWPIGDPGDPEFGFCGADKCEGYSYCARHCRIAYVVKHDRAQSPVPGFRQCVVLQPQGRSCSDEGIRGLAAASGMGNCHPETGAN